MKQFRIRATGSLLWIILSLVFLTAVGSTQLSDTVLHQISSPGQNGALFLPLIQSQIKSLSVGEDPTLIAVGDIGQCSNQDDEATAVLVDNLPGTIALVGDLLYPDASATSFQTCFSPSWGDLRTASAQPQEITIMIPQAQRVILVILGQPLEIHLLATTAMKSEPGTSSL